MPDPIPPTPVVSPPVAPVVAPPTTPSADSLPPPPTVIGVQHTNTLPADKLNQAYQSGVLQFNPEEKIPVLLKDGRTGTVSHDQVTDVINGGGRIIPQAWIDKAHEKKEYGGITGAIGAGVAGVARGLSVGISDPLAVGAARLVGGDQSAERMRSRLKGFEDVFPVTSTASEMAGMLAPALLTDGASVAAEGAEGASVLARTARLLSAPLDGISGIGRLAERSAANVLPEIGEGLAGLASKAASKAVGAAAEGGLINLGQTISESTLGDTDLTAEKLLASLNHGAVIGGLTGGAFSLAGDALSASLEKLSPELKNAAADQSFKMLNSTKKITEKIENTFDGGTRGLGRTLLDLDILPKEGNILENALRPEELLPRIEAKQDEIGQKLGEIVKTQGLKIKIKDLNDQIEGVIADLRKNAGWGHIVKSIEDYRDDLIKKMTATVDEGAVAAGKKAPSLYIPPHLEPLRETIEKTAQAASAGDQSAINSMKQWEKEHGVVRTTPESGTEVPEKDLMNIEVPAETLFQQKKALAALVYKDIKSNDPVQRVQQLRQITGKMEDMIMDSIGRLRTQSEAEASKAVYSGEKTFLDAFQPVAKLPTPELKKSLNKQYQALSLAKEALEKNTTSWKTNRNFSLSDYTMGFGPAMQAAASGHILGGAAAAGAALVHRTLRGRGNAFLASTFEKLSAIKSIANHAAKVDVTLQDAVDHAIGGGKTFVVKIPKGAEIPSDPDEKVAFFEKITKDIMASATIDHTPVAGQLVEHTPLLARRFIDATKQATMWLLGQIPPNPPIGSKTPSDQDISSFLMKYSAVNDPVGTISNGLATGNVSPTQMNAIRDCGSYSKLLDSLQKTIAGELKKAATAGKLKSLPYDLQQSIHLIFNEPDWSQSPEGVKALQDNTQPLPNSATPPTGGGKAGKKVVDSTASKMMSASEARASGMGIGQSPGRR